MKDGWHIIKRWNVWVENNKILFDIMYHFMVYYVCGASAGSVPHASGKDEQ